MNNSKTTALVMAAGYSSRMQDFKPLLPLGQEKVIEKTINNFVKAGITDIRIVVGYQADLLLPVLEPLPVRILYNEDFAQGMFSSVLVGVNSLETDVAAFFLHPADIPLVKPRTIRRILLTYQKYAEEKRIIFPCYKGARGHPPLIPSYLKQYIRHWHGTDGLRGLLSKLSPKALELTVPDQGILLDMDTPQDYQHVLQHHQRQQAPSVSECLEILANHYVSSPILKHCQVVASVAKQLAESLNRVGCCLDLQLITASALLHDLAKGNKNHASVGAQIIKQLGYDKVAEIVQCHMDIKIGPCTELNEAHIVYLADKLVKEDQIITLEERFNNATKKFAHIPEIMNKVMTRLEKAQHIQKQAENILGDPLHEYIGKES